MNYCSIDFYLNYTGHVPTICFCPSLSILDQKVLTCQQDLTGNYRHKARDSESFGVI